MVRNFIEFVLLKDEIEEKFSVVEKHVNSLFDVQLMRTKEEDNLRCWVKLEGNQNDICRAKVCESWLCLNISLGFLNHIFVKVNPVI